MEKFNFYKELYFRENDRRQEVLNSLNIPIAIITALASISYFYISSFDFHSQSYVNYIFILLFSITGVFIIIAVYFLIRAFSDFTKGYEYSGIPYIKELYDWNIELEKYYETEGNDKELANEHFKKYIMKNMVEHTEHNMYVNDKKHGFIYKSKKNLIIALIFTLLNLFPYGHNYIEKMEKSELINSKIEKLELEIKNLKSINYERQEKKSSSASETATATATTEQIHTRRSDTDKTKK